MKLHKIEGDHSLTYLATKRILNALEISIGDTKKLGYLISVVGHALEHKPEVTDRELFYCINVAYRGLEKSGWRLPDLQTLIINLEDYLDGI